MVCGVRSGTYYTRCLLESSSALRFTESTVIPTLKCELQRRCRGWNQKGSRLPKFLFSCLLAVRLLRPFSFDKSFLEKQSKKTSVCRRRCWTVTGGHSGDTCRDRGTRGPDWSQPCRGAPCCTVRSSSVALVYAFSTLVTPQRETPSQRD